MSTASAAGASQTAGLLKMRDLAERSGVSAGTIKHYLREGLLPEPVKTSRNMAYYPAEFVDRIKMIKQLQEERYMPLRVIKDLLEGGKRVAWGAKTIPSGGYFAMPKRLAVPGMVVAGDAASMVNVPTLKGVHYAMHAGMYAAETIVESLKQDSVNFEAYDEKVHKSLIEKDLYE